MKKLILILAIAFSGNFAYAQKVSVSSVPVAVTSKFSTLYPNSVVDQWKKEKGNYEAKFMQNSTKMCVVMDANGNVVKTTTSVSTSELPGTVSDYVAKNYAGKTISEAYKTSESDGKTKYEAKVSDNFLCFDSNGKFIKSEKRKD